MKNCMEKNTTSFDNPFAIGRAISYLSSSLVHNPQSPQYGQKLTWTRTTLVQRNERESDVNRGGRTMTMWGRKSIKMAGGKERKMKSWLWRPWPWRCCKLCIDFDLRSRHHGSCGCDFALWPRHSRPGNLLLQFSYTEILTDIYS